MATYKSIELRDELVAVVRHMDSVEQYRETLQGLQAVWDNLTLLGQLSGTGTEMGATRQAFARLTSELLNRLCEETLKKCIEEMSAKAQVAIDILVRNLFERTADIGFLATDEDIRRYVLEATQAQDESPDGAGRAGRAGRAGQSGQAEGLRRRFAEYVAKYSVYSDIVLLDKDGTVLARHDDSVHVARSAHALVDAALTTRDAYVESFGEIDLLPGCPRALVYSFRVCDENGTPLGVLCLCFRFANEMERIFAGLSRPHDWSVITLIDARGYVIASSDAQHIPLGVRVPKHDGARYRIDRFAGREYLTATRPTQGYQGYQGPGWLGHVMLPIQHAFEEDAAQTLAGIDPATLDRVMHNATLFGEELRGIPLQADRIQRELNRSVWNGNVRQSTQRLAGNPSFSKVLLWEISKTGSRTKDVFARSIANLHETVVSSILNDSRFFAALAIDIMDRNLYERANDCRWWALTTRFGEHLAQDEVTASDARCMTNVLRTINGLYTVYANIVVFDRQARLIASAQEVPGAPAGQPLREDWVRQVLALSDAQGYAVSAFARTPFYGNRPTYIYGAAIRANDDGRVVGGIGVVFDSAPQFAAMLRDALPRDRSGQVPHGTFAVFVDAHGGVIASSDTTWDAGSVFPGNAHRLADDGGGTCSIAQIGESLYAVGSRRSAGYREYKSDSDAYRNDISALVCVPLCHSEEACAAQAVKRACVVSDAAGQDARVEIATFLIGRKWFGLDSACIIESVDFAGIATAPGAARELAGYLMYRGAPIAVFDLHTIVDPGAPPREGGQQVIVLQCEGYPSPFGIRVDDLGEIPEIDAARLRPVPELASGGNILAERIVMTERPEQETLLVVLSAGRIARRLIGPPAPSDARPLAARIAIAAPA